MKTIYKIFFLALTLFLFNACEQNYIDPVSEVDPGVDETAPQITINFPVEGSEIKLPELVSSIEISFEVTDDIEIITVEVLYNGESIATYDEFKDYRKLIVDDLVYDNVEYGMHTVTVKATDKEGKTSSVDVNFEKVPAYTPKYVGEILYMPFDGDYLDLISFQQATVVGNPGFSDDNVVGLKSYAGAADSYLTFPTEGLQHDELTAGFWLKINADPDRAGILVMAPEDLDNPDSPNNRKNGFRFFRENAGGNQRFKLNAGNGDADTWFDGNTAADVDPSIDTWHHFAFTISPTECVVYIDGQVVKQGDFTGIDWSGCDVLSIMSGAPRWTGWNHWSDVSLMDELRMFDRALTQDEIQGIITDDSGATFEYVPKYDGEVFYMPFEDDSFLEWVTQSEPTVVGTPGFGEGKVGNGYSGNIDSYLTFPTADLQADNFSAVFWLKIILQDPEPDYGHRSGVLVMSPVDPDNPEAGNNRKNGFRFFHEGSAESQRFKLNAGNGTADNWFDGGTAADVDVTTNEWHHFAFTISPSECVVYIDGEVVKQGAFTGIDWTGCDVLSIMSGAPRWLGWNHWSDVSSLDELRLFKKALTQTEIQGIIADEQ